MENENLKVNGPHQSLLLKDKDTTNLFSFTNNDNDTDPTKNSQKTILIQILV